MTQIQEYGPFALMMMVTIGLIMMFTFGRYAPAGVVSSVLVLALGAILATLWWAT